MSTTKKKKTDGEQGFVLVLALLALLVLTLIAIGGLTSSSFENTIAGNDLRAKKAFLKSDGGTELGAQLIEVSYSCEAVATSHVTPNMVVYTPILKNNDTAPSGSYPSETARDICWPSGDPANPTLSDCTAGSGKEQTNIVVYGSQETLEGYETIQGEAPPVAYIHQIIAQNVMPDKSSAAVQVEWYHVISDTPDPGLCR